MIVNSWNLSEIDYMNFSPYHYSFQIYTQIISLKKRIENWTKSSNIDEIIIEEFNKKSEEEKHIYLNENSNVNSREISLLVNQRSINVFSELPFNLALYGLLLNIIAQKVDMNPDKIILNIGEIYLDVSHIKQAKEQISRQPYHLCKLKINDENWKTFIEKDNNFDEFINSIQINDFSIDNYVHHQVLI
jgi:thymidylate synthase